MKMLAILCAVTGAIVASMRAGGNCRRCKAGIRCRHMTRPMAMRRSTATAETAETAEFSCTHEKFCALCVLCGCFLCVAACNRPAAGPPPVGAAMTFAQFVDGYLDRFATCHPSIAAGNGIHAH